MLLNSHLGNNIWNRNSPRDKPETIYDFYGFEEELYTMTYPAKSSPDLVGRVVELLEAQKLPVEKNNKRGFDHGKSKFKL